MSPHHNPRYVRYVLYAVAAFWLAVVWVVLR